MKIPAEPAREAERLAVLRGTGLLDSPPEPTFDDLTRLTSFICGTPIALISLLDRHRAWFKSRVGFDISELPRDLAFCSHAVAEPRDDRLFSVRDALLDDRFSDNPLVTSAPRVRFYAGAVLMTADRHALGTLCVIDHVPRELGPEQRSALQALARQVVAQIDLRRALIDAARSSRPVEPEHRASVPPPPPSSVRPPPSSLRPPGTMRPPPPSMRPGSLAKPPPELSSLALEELRAAANSMRGALGLLEPEVLGRLSAQALDVVQLAQTNADRLMLLLSDMLDLQQIEAGQLDLSLTDIETPQLVTSVLEGLWTTGYRAQVELRASLVERRLLHADEPRLRRVLTHLLSSAIKRSAPGSVVDLCVAAVPASRVRFEVREDGPGLPAESRRAGTSGLWRVISKAIVERHGGTLGFGGGADPAVTCWLELPSMEAAPRSVRPRLPKGAPRPSGEAAFQAALAELRAGYKLELPGRLQDLSAAIQRARRAAGDTGLLDQARAKARKIATTAGSHGFPSVSKAARQVEEALAAVHAGEVTLEHAWGEIAGALAASLAAMDEEARESASR